MRGTVTITGELIRSLLRKIARADYDTLPVLDLALLNDAHEADAITRGHQLYDLLRQITLIELQRRRSVVADSVVLPDPETGNSIAEALQWDFRQGDSELKAWSSLYHAYFTPAGVLSAQNLAHSVPYSRRWIDKLLDTACNLLADRLWDSERQAQKVVRYPQLHRYLAQAEYHQFFGRSAQLESLVTALTTLSTSGFISIEGLGGIGKTALIQEALRRLLDSGALPHDIVRVTLGQSTGTTSLAGSRRQAERHLDRILVEIAQVVGRPDLEWLSREQRIDGLKIPLANKSYVVVVENLETAEDAQIIPQHLAALAGPTRFIFASRHTLEHHAHVRVEHLGDLSLDESRMLLTSLLPLGRRNIAGDEMDTIYQAVGGSPLALRLMAPQLKVPLPDVLEKLRQARLVSFNAMLARIYQRDWEEYLDANARYLLLHLLVMSPTGEDFDWIQKQCDLPHDILTETLKQLEDYKLVEITGSLQKPIYQLHRLTVQFLETRLKYDQTV